jgi:hypothetical protein
VLDAAPLEQLTPAVLAAPVHLFDVKPATLYRYRGSHGLEGAKLYAAPNPPFGAILYYHLATKVDGPIQVTIRDARGGAIATLKGMPEAGLHRLVWPMRATPEGESGEGALVSPGEYIAELRAGERVLTKRFRVEADQ